MGGDVGALAAPETEIEVFRGDRQALKHLFLLAEDSEAQLDAYMALGDVLVARDGSVIIGHAQIIGSDRPGAFELKNIAVLEDRQGEGVGRQLVEAAIGHARALGGTRMVVSTATAGVGQLRFYQRLGFRFDRIVRDAFGPDQGYPEGILIDGIPLRDQIFLDRDL